MKNLEFLKKRHNSPSVIIYLSFLITVAAIALIILLHTWKNIPYGTLTRDPVQVLNVLPFYGFLSNIGIIFWSATVGVCIFSLLINSNKKEFTFYILALVFTTLLLVDDCFMLHDVILPIFGINEIFLYVAYAFLAILFIIYFRSIVFHTPFYFLFISVIFLGLSVTIDVVVHYIEITNHYFYEDTAKFIGIVNWWIYFSSVSYLTAKGKLKF